MGLYLVRRLGELAGTNIPAAQDALAKELGYLSIPINNSLSVINIAAQTPNLIGNIGTATGTSGSYLDEPILQPWVNLGTGTGNWSANPSWENATGVAEDISTFFGTLAGGAKPLPSFNKPLLKPGATQTFGGQNFADNCVKSATKIAEDLGLTTNIKASGPGMKNALAGHPSTPHTAVQLADGTWIDATILQNIKAYSPGNKLPTHLEKYKNVDTFSPKVYKKLIADLKKVFPKDRLP